jgi:hypothetical protein
MLQIIRRNTHAGIAHADLDRFILHGCGHGQQAAAGAVIDGIADQVQ